MKKRKLRFSVDGTINNFLGQPTRIVAVALLLVFRKKMHPILIVCISAALGIAAGYMVL